MTKHLYDLPKEKVLGMFRPLAEAAAPSWMQLSRLSTNRKKLSSFLSTLLLYFRKEKVPLQQNYLRKATKVALEWKWEKACKIRLMRNLRLRMYRTGINV